MPDSLKIITLVYLTSLLLSSCLESAHIHNQLDRLVIKNDINENDTQLFKADSLYILLQFKEAKSEYKKILDKSKNGSTKEAYVLSRLALIQFDFSSDTIEDQPEIAEHHFRRSDLFYYLIKTDFRKIRLDRLIEELHESSSFGGKANYLNQLSLYYDLVLNDVKTSEQYSKQLSKHLEQIDISTIWHYKYVLQAINLNSYKRNDVKAMYMANRFLKNIVNRKNCHPDILSKIHEQKAFLYLRLSLLDEAKKEVDSIYALNKTNTCSAIIESAERIILYTHLLSNSHRLFDSSVQTYNRRRNRCGGNNLSLDEMIGFSMLRRMEIDSAKFYLEKADSDFNKKDKTQVKIHKITSSTLSKLYQTAGEYNKALNKYCEHLEVDIPEFDAEYILSIDRNDQYFYADLLKFGSILYDQWTETGAKETLDLSIKFLNESEKRSYAIFSSINEQSILPFIEYHDELYNLLIASYNDLYQIEGRTELLERSWFYNSKQFNLLLQRDIIINNSQNVLDQEDIVMKKKLEYDLKRIMSNKLRLFDELEQYIKEEDTLQKKVGDKITQFSSDEGNARAANIGHFLDDKTSLICFTVVKNNIYRYHISNSSISVKKLVYSEFEQASIDSFNHYLSQYSDDIEKYKKHSQNIFKHLIGSNLMEQSKGQWIVMMDPKLSPLNLAALTVNDSGYNFCDLPYLLNAKDISYSMTDRLVSDASASSGNEQDEDRIIGFAYSDEHSTPSKYYSELNGSYREIESIKNQHSQSIVRTGCNATKEEFIKLIKQPHGILHLALHGKSNEDIKDDVMLIFRDPNCDTDTLYGYELMRYKLKNSKVILSACDTDIGKTQHGEGSYSLTRYFLLSGAKEVISSIWKLNDMSTALLFDQYYDNNENMRIAQNAMLKNPETCHPYYWSGLLRYRQI